MIIVPFSISSALSQGFTITNAGELLLGTDQITDEGNVKKYFGMNVIGVGNSILKVTVGDQSAEKPYEFKVNNTKLYSYLLNYDLAEEISIAFRRGVYGLITFEILNSDKSISDSTVINLNVSLSKKNCKKHPSKSLKKCERVNLAKASKSQKRTFVKKFIQSIKGPIVLEP